MQSAWLILLALVVTTATAVPNKSSDENTTPSTAASAIVKSSAPASRKRLKILISAPAWGLSHMKFQGALADALVDAGHEVHIFTFTVNALLENVTASDKAHKVYRHERPRHMMDVLHKTKIAMDQFGGALNFALNGMWQNLIGMLCDVCPEILANTELLEQLAAEKYDFGISEAYEVCLFGVFHRIGIRSMAASQAIALNAHIVRYFGIPIPSSFVHSMWTFSSNPSRMTFMDRALNLLNDFYDYYYLRPFAYDVEQPMFDAAFGKESPKLREIMRNVSFAFVNSYEFLSMPRPISPKIVYVGGIGQMQKAELPKEFAAIVERAKSGVIVLAFGTFAITSTMDDALVHAFLETFEHFPDYEVIWKFSHQQLHKFQVPSNVHIFDWIPQMAILNHTKTRALISHCGLNSINEAARFGVPVIGFPLFAEQPFNAATLEYFGMGIRADIRALRTIGSSILVNALRRLLDDENDYRAKAALISRKLGRAPFSPAERLTKWVEFAAEFPDLNELNMPAADEMGWLAYYSLDVIGAVLAVAAMWAYVSFRLLEALQISFVVKSKTE